MIHTDGKPTIANGRAPRGAPAFEVVGEAIATLTASERIRIERIRRENARAALVCGCPSCRRTHHGIGYRQTSECNEA